VALYALKFAEAAPLASLVYSVTLPVMLFKQLCNVVQMLVAMSTILEYDAEQRSMPAAPKAKPK